MNHSIISGVGLLYQDDFLLVLEKPYGLLSVPGRGEDKVDCVQARVSAVFTDALIVHRLDMATSGIMLMARGKQMQGLLSTAFAVRAVTKQYVALVHGILQLDRGTIDLPLSADWPNRPKQKVDLENGKPSLTHYEVVLRDVTRDITRVQLIPVTGRAHQLRVHLNAIGHAILGDTLYADAVVRGKSARLMLHAEMIEFAHPVTRQMMKFYSEAGF